MELKVLVYGTRTSKDKSGAYLFLPDSEAKVPERPHGAGWLPCMGGAWEGPGILGPALLSCPGGGWRAGVQMMALGLLRPEHWDKDFC